MKRLAAICTALGMVGAIIGFAAAPSSHASHEAGSSWAVPIDLSQLLPL